MARPTLGKNYPLKSARILGWGICAFSLTGTESVGRTPKRVHSPRGRSRHLLETPFSEPFLRTLLRTLFTVKPTAGPLLRTNLRTLPQNPGQNLLRTLILERCVAVRPLSRAPKRVFSLRWSLVISQISTFPRNSKISNSCGISDGARTTPIWVHQNRASLFASDFYRRRGYRREFRSEDPFYPFSSQKKSRFASDFLRRGNRAPWGLKKSRGFSGSGKNRRRNRRESRDFGALRPPCP